VAAVVAAALAVAPTAPARPESLGTLELVESVPVETALDLPGLRNTPEVWLEMVGSARETLDLETFYFSDRPDGPSELGPVLEAIAAAAQRGVRIRVLTDPGFHRTYPEIPDRLAALPGAEVRLLDARGLWGGVLHAKCLVVDGEEMFVGSQNWDWRALEHIHELGVRIRDRVLAARLTSIFELDWALAGPAPAPPPAAQSSPPTGPRLLRSASGDTVSVTLAASPPQALPAGVPWDEPMLVELLDGARETAHVHLLSYSPRERDGTYYEVLDDALRRAAARGVEVRVLLSNWSKRESMVPYVRSLAAVPGIEIRFTNLPEWSGGFVPFARVEHPKYVVVDGGRCWIGTGNWARSYFHGSRNVSLFVDGAAVAADAGRFFDTSWNSPWAEVVSPCGEYAPPRIGE